MYVQRLEVQVYDKFRPYCSDFRQFWLILVLSSFSILPKCKNEGSPSQFVTGNVRNILSAADRSGKTDCRPNFNMVRSMFEGRLVCLSQHD